MDVEGERQVDQTRGQATLNDSVIAPSSVLEHLPDAVLAITRDGRIAFVNRLGEELFGYSREELLGQPIQMLWPERLHDRYGADLERYLRTDHPRTSDDPRASDYPRRSSREEWRLRRDGSEFITETTCRVAEGNAGPVLLFVERDISERHAVEMRLKSLAAISQRALAGADPAVLATDALELMRTALPISGAEVRLANGSVLASTGELTAEATEQSIGSGDELLVAPEREFNEEEMHLLHTVADVLATALARLRGEERMRHDAVHDPLTGLANRTLLRDRLEQALARSQRKGGASGLLFVDLDNFKQVNDEYGHAMGDAVLVELGRRLQTAVRPTDTVARLGGDEFVVVCEELDEQTAVALGRRLHDALERPLVIDGVEHRLSASIGIALGKADPDGLLGNADAAVYRAKAHGRGRVELFQ
jgi:diguanylate cyclase (GGDEF)-like protein/PAS domain S-box-containing protein